MVDRRRREIKKRRGMAAVIVETIKPERKPDDSRG
jgi:hypothetical protein